MNVKEENELAASSEPISSGAEGASPTELVTLLVAEPSSSSKPPLLVEVEHPSVETDPVVVPSTGGQSVQVVQSLVPLDSEEKVQAPGGDLTQTIQIAGAMTGANELEQTPPEPAMLPARGNNAAEPLEGDRHSELKVALVVTSEPVFIAVQSAANQDTQAGEELLHSLAEKEVVELQAAPTGQTAMISGQYDGVDTDSSKAAPPKEAHLSATEPPVLVVQTPVHTHLTEKTSSHRQSALGPSGLTDGATSKTSKSKVPTKHSSLPALVPLPQPSPLSGPSADMIMSGPPIPAIERIKLFSDKQWEDFVLEWADSLREQYERVERCGGAGDMGRDVVATVKNGNGVWDNYQCKHYKDSLKPSDVWIELGKLAFYSKQGEYVYPRRYYFIAPQGAGTKLSNLLKKPDDLRAGLIANWDAYCREAITLTQKVELDDDMKAHIAGLDFSIFDATPPLRIIDGHAKTRWYVTRFGGGLPLRPMPAPPPIELGDTETLFVRELLRAYGDHLKQPVNAVSDLAQSSDLCEHFSDSRLEFYSAESLRAFSRDTLPPGEFEKLQDEVHSGIRDEIRSDHVDGYRRVVAVVKTARTLPLGGHALHGRMAVRDYGGICHQLANDGKVRWIK